MSSLQYRDPSSVSESDLSFRDFLNLLSRRRWAVLWCVLICTGLGAAAFLLVPRGYVSTAQMVLVQHAGGAETRSDYSAPLLESVETQVGMLQSDGMIDRTVQRLKNDALTRGRSVQVEHLDDPEALSREIGVDNPKGSTLLNVSVKTRSAVESATLADAICQAFVAWKQEIAVRDAQTVVANLSSQTASASSALKVSENALLSYEKSSKMVDPGDQEKAILAELQSRNADVAGYRQAVESDDARVASLSSELDQANAAIASGTGVRDDALTQSLQSQLATQEMARVDAAQKFTAAYPFKLGPMDADIKDTKARLAASLGNALSNRPTLQTQSAIHDSYLQAVVAKDFDAAKLAAALGQQSSAQARFDALPASDIESGRLQRGVDVATQNYEGLEAALASAKLDLGKITGNVRITQPATIPDLPAPPGLGLCLLIGAFLGLFVSALTVLMQDQFEERVRGIDDAGRLLGGPAAGVLPRLSARQIEDLQSGRLLPSVSEALSLARVNLMLHGRAGEVILVTSARSGEGKSLVATQLAQSYVQAGRNVLLADCNFGRPLRDTWTQFRTESPLGLSDVLLGETGLDDVTYYESTDPDLEFIHCGTSVPSATDLLSHRRLGEIIETMRRRVDVVILDSAACSEAPDALLLAKHSDTVVQVVESGRIDRRTETETAQALAATGARVVLMINKVTERQYREDRVHCILTGGQRAQDEPSSPALPMPEPLGAHRQIVYSGAPVQLTEK